MNIFVVIQQMLVLLVMMLVGYFAYRKTWIDDNSYGKISKIAINILNPCLMINGVLGKEVQAERGMVLQNLFLVVVYFLLLVLLSKPVVSLLRIKKEHKNLYRLMLMLSNVGFMGIPVISSIYGKESMIFVVFYMLGYNLLLYTYGVYLASLEKEGSGEEKGSAWKNLLNPGVGACVVAILIFASGIQMPDSVCTFFDYMGNSVVPFSMILIGASVAKGGKKEFFTDGKMYVFSAIKMLLIPITGALVLRLVDFPAMVEGIFILMLAMPVGSIVVMLAKECGADEMECTKGSILTTLLSVITIPIVSLFLTF